MCSICTTSGYSTLGRRAARQLGIPVVGDMHENYPEALRHYAWSTRFPGNVLVSVPRWRCLERAWVGAMDRVVYVAEEMQARCRDFGLPVTHQIVVPNTINVQEVDSCEVSKGLVNELARQYTIVYTGSINLHRGLDVVIRAMRRVTEHTDALLVIVGEGSTRRELEELAKTVGVADHVRFEGWQSRSLLKSYILGSSVCIAPHVKGPHNDAASPHKPIPLYVSRTPGTCDQL